LVVFEAEHCPFCAQFREQVLKGWSARQPIATTLSARPPAGWSLAKPLWATPTIVFFRDGREVSRYTGYNGEKERFWKWLGYVTLSEEQKQIAYQAGTERSFTGSLLDNHRAGVYVDPVSGAPLFRSGTKFSSGTGWPSFFQPIEGAVTLHEDNSEGMHRVEVRSASTGIHLGHVFDDGPPPTGKRYCINSDVLRFVPGEETKD
jgi:peptide methionine sulfoxide reductase msrA/msrB